MVPHASQRRLRLEPSQASPPARRRSAFRGLCRLLPHLWASCPPARAAMPQPRVGAQARRAARDGGRQAAARRARVGTEERKKQRRAAAAARAAGAARNAHCLSPPCLRHCPAAASLRTCCNSLRHGAAACSHPARAPHTRARGQCRGGAPASARHGGSDSGGARVAAGGRCHRCAVRTATPARARYATHIIFRRLVCALLQQQRQ